MKPSFYIKLFFGTFGLSFGLVFLAFQFIFIKETPKKSKEEFIPVVISSDTPRLERPADVPEKFVREQELVEEVTTKENAYPEERLAIEPLESSAFVDDSVCHQTISYELGEVDPGFNLEENFILQIISEAEAVWEKEFGYNFFHYQKNGADLVINFAYDERQQMAQDSLVIEKRNQSLSDQLELIKADYFAKRTLYNDLIEQYDEDLIELESGYHKLDERIQSWNESSRTDEKEIKKINKLQKELEDDKKSLNKLVNKTNSLAYEMDELAEKEKIIIDSFNKELMTYKQRYNQVRDELQKGLYKTRDGDRAVIDIYQFYDQDDLRLLLTHEMGHAIGLGHVENEKSIMYPILGGQQLYPLIFSKEDRQELSDLCSKTF